MCQFPQGMWPKIIEWKYPQNKQFKFWVAWGNFTLSCCMPPEEKPHLLHYTLCMLLLPKGGVPRDDLFWTLAVPRKEPDRTAEEHKRLTPTKAKEEEEVPWRKGSKKRKCSLCMEWITARVRHQFWHQFTPNCPVSLPCPNLLPHYHPTWISSIIRYFERQGLCSHNFIFSNFY